MSRAPQKSTQRLRFVAAVAVAGLATLLAVAGCGAGQNTQTDSVEPAVNGISGEVGAIQIRNAQFAYPRGGTYPAGGETSLVVTIVNTGASDDELVEVTSPVARSVKVSGDRALIARRALQVGTPGQEVSGAPSSSVVVTTTPPSSSSTTGSPSSGAGSTTSTPSSTTSAAPAPVEIGKATIVLSGLTEALRSGKTYPVTFVFRNGGTITLDLPIASPTTPRPEPTGASHG